MEGELVYKDLLWKNEARVSGALCFYGTRIPVSHLVDYLENDSTIDEFCSDYHVDLHVAKAVVKLMGENIEKLLVPKAA